jgi:hypothetical protein
MHVEESDFVGWEPCTIRFDFAQNLVPESFQQVVEQWLLKDRVEARVCACTPSYSEYSVDGGTAVVLRGEWFCRTCVQALANAVERKIPKLSSVTLGTAILQPSAHDPKFVSIEGKSIEFEDRRRCLVKPFLIAKRPVSIGEFLEFTKTTSYKTVAEQQSRDESFNSHSGLGGFSERALLRAAVKFIAPIDAEAFCRYKGYRLPTEEEWFAAAVIEPNEVGPTGTYRRRLDLMKCENAILFGGSEITSTRTEEGLVVARRGPRYFLKEGWRARMQFERQFIERSHTDVSLTFRVVVI